MASSLATWLASLRRAELAGILARRTEALRGPEPRDLSELAARLQHADGVFDALTSLTLPAVEAVEALVSLGPAATRKELAELLDAGAYPDHEANVDAALEQLREYAVVWPVSGDGLRHADPLRDAFPDPLGLGAPARVLLSQHPVADLQRIEDALGLRRARSKRQATDAIVERLSDAAFVRARIAELPAPARKQLIRRAEPTGQDVDYLAGFQAEQVLVEQGLLVPAPWGAQTYLPAEVTRALRGEHYRAPFTPHPPDLDEQDVGVDAVEAEAGVRAGEFAERTATVLDLIAGTPLARLKSGGVGTRELTRLAKAVGAPDVVIRLIVELAAAAGLLDTAAEQVLVTPAYDDWREDDPAQRLAPLLVAWWQLPTTPTSARDRDGKTIPALARRMPCQLCQSARSAVLASLAALPDGVGTSGKAAVAAALWRCPTAHVTVHDDGTAHVWSEAEALGVIARGAITGLGRAVLTGSGLAAALGRLLPESTEVAAFGSDLTVVVSGAPAARVRALLDRCADREGRGGAAVWRFTPASVRRALDAGTTASDLEADLASIAASELPQPLRYLIGDVARRHGHLRVATATAVIQSADEALLAEVVGHRKLRALRLRLIAPTVAIGASSVTDTMSALRDAGYLPLAERPDGTVQLDQVGTARATVSRRIAPARQPAPAADPRALAKRLLSGGPATASAPASPPSMTEALIAEFATGLDTAQTRQLAHAVDEGQPVRIEYQAASGGYSTRVVSDLLLDPPFLVGWCHLRDAERMFTLARIVSAVAV